MNENGNKPSVGSVIGLTIACWFAIAAICALVSMFGIALFYGIEVKQPSTGGLLGLALAIVCGFQYFSSGDSGKAARNAAIMGLVLGVVVIVFTGAYIPSGVHR